MLEHLRSLGGSVAFHIREAIWDYLRKKQSQQVSSSLSRKEGDTNV